MCEKFPNATQFGETARKIYSDLTDSDCQIARIHPFAVPLFDSYVDWERSAFPIELVKKEPPGAGSNARALTLLPTAPQEHPKSNIQTLIAARTCIRI